MKRGGGLLRAFLVPGVAVVVAGAALVFQAPQLAIAIAQGCVTPGNDGPNATLTGVVNTYYPATAGVAAGTNSISVGPRIAGASPAIAAGDLLLVIQMQDADINGTNTIVYGDGATGHGSTALNSTGLYEYVMATSAVVGGVVTIAGSGAGNGLVNSYDFSTTVTATHGFRTFQVIRVPQYSSATVTAGLTAAAWNGAVHAGGVLAIDVAGQLNLNAQTVSVDQLGFKGALGVGQTGGAGLTGTDYVRPSGSGAHGYKGEGVSGTPHFLYDAIAGAQAASGAADGYPNGDAARGAPGTAGGGGTDSNPSANDQNSGGGGGANGGAGGMGGESWNAHLPVGGLGGAAFPATATKLVLGGGGGAGTRNNSANFASSGGTGGGIVMIRTGSLAGTGTITANGGVGVTPVNDGGGGGGAGGSVVVTTNTGTVNGLTIHADGGQGTDAWPTGGTGAANYHGPGGGGGGGVIITSNALPPAQTSVVGGVHGTTTVDLNTFGSVSGSAGVVSTTTPGAIPGSSSGAECLPVLTTTKTTSTPNVNNTVGGTTATYSITVGNAASTGSAIGISISDALPAGFTYASTGSVTLIAGATRPATVNPAAGATNPVFGTFTIPGGGSVVITFTVNIAASVAPGTYNNPATATYLDPTRTTVGGTIAVGYAGGGAERVTVHAPDLTITKSHVDPITRGTTATYTVTATNSGNVPTSGTVTVTDTLPAGLTPTGAAGPGWTCPAPVGQVVTCTRADVLAGPASYPPITVTVTVLQGAASSVTNTASVSGGSETNSTNDTANDPTNIVSSADIAVTKTVDNATPNQGAPVVFTITATNNGPSDATGVHVTDLLPPGLTFVSASSGAYTQGSGVWIVGNLANGGSSTLMITATVTGTTAVVNTATKSAETEPDPVGGNNSASVTVTGQAADIAITKTVTSSTPNVGGQVTFTVTALNNGPSTATGVVVTDLLPGSLTFVTSTPGLPAYTPGTGAWNVGTLANGASATLTITVTVTSTTPATNTATKAAEDQTDPVAGNNSASATVTGQAADIAITKTVSNPTPDFGSNVTFTVTAHNNGPSNATGVHVTDVLPSGLTYVSSSTVSGTYDPISGLWNIGPIANASTATLTITAKVTNVASQTNTATKSAEDQPDPVAGNDSAVATVTPVAADIAVTKSVDNATPNVGNTVTFTVTATNNGPSGATGVVVNDLLPAGLTWVSSTSTGPYDHVGGDWTIGALASGANQTLTIVATVTGTTPVTNTAFVKAAVQPDPVPGNNSASVIVTGQSADIAITKTVDNATPNVGGQVTFTVTAHNNGPSTATGVKVADALPGTLTFVSSAPGSPAYALGVWNVGTLANGATATLTITATVTSTTPATNTATKSAEDQTDPVAGNNSASATVTGQSADIAITKTVDNGTPNFGSNVTFTVTAHNNGPSTATGVKVSDVLPAGLTLVTSTPGSPAFAAGVWNVGTLANGATATLTITATVTTTAPTTNTATKSAEDQPDPAPGNNTASATITPVAADISLTKGVDNTRPNEGTPVTFTITATNNGPSDATGVVVNDKLPVGLSFVSSTSAGAYDPVSGDWTVGALASGANQILTIVATATGSTPVTNTAFVKAAVQPDPVPGNNTASITVTGQAADIAITKTVDNATPNLNSNVTFTITAHNNGPNNATGLQVTDILPPGRLVFVSAAPLGAYDSGTGVWNIVTLANGATTTLTIVATVNTTAPVTNTATKTSEDQTDPVPANNSASVLITPVSADIAITKTVDNSTPTLNTNVTFTVTAHNNGPSTATGVKVADLLPPGLVYISSTTTAGPYDQVLGAWTVGTLTNGSTATLTITAKVTSLTNVTNTATKSAEDQVDPVGGNNSASAAVSCCTADIAVTKTVDNLTPNFGSNVTYTVTATNNGPADATGLQLTDQLPASLIYSSSTVTGATTYDSVSGVWNIGLLTKFTTATLTITAKVNSPAPITNTAGKTAENEADPTPLDDTASVTITPVAADIAVAKTVDNSLPNLNGNVTFTVTATNNGPSNATGVKVSDKLPPGLNYLSSGPSVGSYDSVAGVWTIGALANGSKATLTILAKMTVNGPLTNTASTAVPPDQPDPVPGNNTASATVTAQAADISVTKIVDNATPYLNTNVTFTITATNSGPSDATGVEITDNLPAGLAYVSSATAAGTYVQSTGIWHIGGLTNTSTATLTIVAKATTTATVTNTATRTAGNQPDPNSANDSSSVTVTGQQADIAITKSVDNPVPDFGTNVTFNLKATNNGPSTATGVKVTDVLPVGLIIVSSTASGTTSYSGGVWNVGTLTNGGFATLAIVAKVNTTSPLTNVATKSAEDQPDPVNTNDSASATITPIALADIAISKTVSSTTPDLGTNVTFTVTAKNNGPNDASGVNVADALPAGLTLFSATPSAGTSYGAGVWTIGPLTNGASATLLIVATVNTTAPVTNTAAKIAETEVDPNPGNDSATVTVTPVSADIAITKTVDNSAPSLNSKVTFTVMAINNGPSAATGVVVTDQLPAGLTYFSSLPSVGAYDPITGIWSIGGLANGSNATLTLVATVTSTTTVTNTATKTGEVQPDPVAGNNSASASVSGVSADITVTKTVNLTTPTLGQNVTYTLVAHNLGPSTAPGVQLHDMLPAQVTFVSATATQGTYDPVTGIWTVGNMINGSTVTLSLVVTVKASGLIVNTVTVLPGAYFDPNLSNNISSVTIDPPALPGLPNTSAPDSTADTTSVGAAPAAPQMVKGLLLAVLTVVAGLGVLSLAGVGRRRTRARFGRRRSRKQLDRSPGRVTVGLAAGLLTMAIISVSAGDLATTAPPDVTLGPVAGTQLIGGAAVVVEPPPAPPAETFQTATGSIVPSRLRIPAIGVDSWIGAVALRKDGSMNVPDNLWTSSWLASGPRPGQPGNAVIAGHRGVGTPALFSHLETVKAGDRIYVSDAAGNQLIYQVTRVASMDLSASTQVAVFGPTSGQNLVLITCFGRYIPSARTYDHRLVVFSQPVSN
jgi:LPXTG-site transpeptidase (sortase) family protein